MRKIHLAENSGSSDNENTVKMKEIDDTPFRIVEVDDEGWAAFKALEAQHRREYAVSPEAVADHKAWVNTPMPKEPRWRSISPEEQAELKWPEIIPSPTQLPWAELYDWAQESKKPRTP